MERIWKERNWTVYMDELYGLSILGKPVERRINKLLTQGRSMGITVVTGMQRPAWVSRFALSQVTHFITFRVDGADMKRLKDLLGPGIEEASRLKQHEFIWYHVPTDTKWKGRVQDLYV